LAKGRSLEVVSGSVVRHFNSTAPQLDAVESGEGFHAGPNQ